MATFTGADKAIGYLFTASNNTAAEYSSAATYAAGDFVIHEGTLYKCTSAIGTPEDWTPAHWTQTTIMENAGGGGGGGTTVIANPAGAATDTLNKLQVGATIYDIPSGGGSSGHTYSTTEQIVGTWIDGTTVYETTFDLGSDITISYNSWTTLTVQMLNLGGIIGAEIMTATLGTYAPVMATYNSNKYIQLQSLRNTYTNSARYLVLRYTKAS